MGRVIAIAGKGGTGKTTIAALIVRHLQARGQRPILAIDADPNDNLAEALGLPKRGSVAGFTDQFFKDKADVPAGLPKETYLEMCLNSVITESKDFDLLVMGHPEGPGCYCYVNNILRAHLEKLVSNYAYIVVDNEAGMEHISRRTTRRMDRLVIVADYSVKALKAASRISELARELELSVDEAGLVVNRFSEGLPPLNDAIHAVGLPLWQTIPESPRVSANDASGLPVFALPEDDPVVVAVGDLVDKIILNRKGSSDGR